MKRQRRVRRPSAHHWAVKARAALVLCLLTSAVTSAWAAPKLTGRHVPNAVRKVLIEILKRAKLDGAEVTSTTRTIEQQAKVMFNYVNRNGYDAALDLYGPHGDTIIEVCKTSYEKYEKCVSEILPKMVEETRHQVKLLEQQGVKRTELMHTSDTHYTIDIRPESVKNRAAFENAVEAHAKVTRFLKPPRDRNSYHLEIPRAEEKPR